MDQNNIDFILKTEDQATPTMEKAIKLLEQIASNTNKTAQETQNASEKMGGFRTAMIEAQLAAEALEFTLGAIWAFIPSLVGGIESLVKGMIGMGMSAATLKESMLAAQVAGQNVGMTAESITTAVKAMQGLNINAREGTELMNNMAQAHLTASVAINLARAAQNLATQGHVSTNEALRKISDTMKSGYPEELRGISVIVSERDAYARLAEQLHISSTGLDEYQKRQAIANEIIRQGTLYNGLYEKSLDNPAKALRSLQDRFDELKDTFGQLFEGSLAKIIVPLNKIAGAFTLWVDANQDLIRGLGQNIANFVSGPFQGLFNALNNIFGPLERWQKAYMNNTAKLEDQAKAQAEVNKNLEASLPRINAVINQIAAFVLQVAEGAVELYKFGIQAAETFTIFAIWINKAEAWMSDFGRHVELDMLGPLRPLVQLLGGLQSSATTKGYQNNIADLEKQHAGMDKTVQGLNKTLNDLHNKELKAEAGGLLTVKSALEGLSRVKAPDYEGFGKAVDDMGNEVEKGGTKITDEARKIQDTLDKITDEGTSYFDNAASKQAAYSQRISDLVATHVEKLKSLRESLASLNDDFNSASADRSEGHADKKTSISESYAKDTDTIKQNLDKRLASTHKSDDDIVKFFQAQIDARTKKRDDDLKKEDDAYKKQEDKATASYKKQLDKLQDSINAEMDLQKKHQAEFDKFKDAAKQDEFEKAEQAFAKEMDQLKNQHDKRMQELAKELRDEQILISRYRGTSGPTGGETYKPTGTDSGGAKTTSNVSTPTNNYVTFNVNSGLDLKTATSSIGLRFLA